MLTRIIAIAALLFTVALPAQAAKEEAKSTPIPASSKFAKIKEGMSQRQVMDLIGMWNDTEHYTTGKAYIPFYRGKDSVRTAYYYKGEGKIIIGGNDRVVSVHYDASEDGYK